MKELNIQLYTVSAWSGVKVPEPKTLMQNIPNLTGSVFTTPFSTVVDPWHFGTDTETRIFDFD